jgi:hypothetical protein
MKPSSPNLRDDAMSSFTSTRKTVGPQIVLAGIVFKVLFDIHYVYQISPPFSYMGLDVSLDWQKIIESYLISLALVLMISCRMRTPSTMILIMGLFTGVIPLVSIYALQDRSAAFAYMSVMAFVIMLLITSAARVRVVFVRVPPAFFITICVVLVLAVLVMLVEQGAYRHFTFNFDSVYQYREELDAIAFAGPFVYITDWAFSVFSIFLLVWSLCYKNRTIGIFAISALVFMYGCILMKAILFNIPFVLLTYYVIRRSGSIVGLAWGVCGMVLSGMAEAWLLGQSELTALVTRRVLALPAFLANEYFELFRDIGHVYWSNGLFGNVMPYPFADDPQRLVGEFALGSRDTWANNGMFGMGFMQAGFVGMVLYGLVFGLWLYLVDCISVGRLPLEVSVGVMIVPTAVVFTDTDLLTGLLTHGGIAATLMLWLWAGVVREPRQGYARGMRLAAESPRFN